MKRTILAIAGLVLLAGCQQAASTAPARHHQAKTFTMHGVISVLSPCPTTGIANPGYSDVTPGAQVTVTDQKHVVLGVGTLRRGHREMQGMGCRFKFTVSDLPEGRRFYGVTVAHRGTVELSQLNALFPNLTLGY